MVFETLEYETNIIICYRNYLEARKTVIWSQITANLLITWPICDLGEASPDSLSVLILWGLFYLPAFLRYSLTFSPYPIVRFLPSCTNCYASNLACTSSNNLQASTTCLFCILPHIDLRNGFN